MMQSTHAEALQRIREQCDEGIKLRKQFFEEEAFRINSAGLAIAYAIANENKVMLCGNGGSAADCQHIAAEFTNRFVIDRPPLPAIALTTDTSALTAIGNDFGFELVFSKQVEALGRKNDILIAISTSGSSPNVLQAITAAKQRGVFVIGFAGKNGGKMAEMCDACFIVRHQTTALIQEIHISLGHALCTLTDYYLFENVAELEPYLDGRAELPEF